MLREILSALDEDSAAVTPFALETANDLGYVIYQLGRFKEAEAILRPTLEREQALFGDVHMATLNTLRSRGSAVTDQGRFDEAETLYRNALRVARLLYGEEHLETETALFVLALLLERKRG